MESTGRHFEVKNFKKEPIKVTITGGAGQIGYALSFMIAQGRMFGPNQPVELTLLEVPQVEVALNGVVMELCDCALPLLAGVKGATNVKDGFTGCQVALLVGARPRGPGMERKDLLAANAKIFEDQGKALNEYADPDCKVLVVGNPANTNCMIAQKYATKLKKENFTALTRLDQNRGTYQIATKLGLKIHEVRNVIIWGNHSSTQVPDIHHACAGKENAFNAIGDNEWFEKTFIPTVAKRGAAIIDARKMSSAGSAANAICDHVHDWFNGTKEGEFVSMGVMSDGSYGIPEGINFSFPVTCSGGKWKVVTGLKWNDFIKGKIDETIKELLDEKKMALNE